MSGQAVLPRPVCPPTPRGNLIVEYDIAESFDADIEPAVVDVKVGRVMRGRALAVFWHPADEELEGRCLLAKECEILGAGYPFVFHHVALAGRLLKRWQHLAHEIGCVVSDRRLAVDRNGRLSALLRATITGLA